MLAQTENSHACRGRQSLSCSGNGAFLRGLFLHNELNQKCCKRLKLKHSIYNPINFHPMEIHAGVVNRLSSDVPRTICTASPTSPP